MKQNYKIGDKVISIKPGLLNGLEGDVLFNNTDKSERQLSVICGASGVWNLSYHEVMPADKESALEVAKLPFETEDKPKQKKLKMTSINGSTVIKEKGSKNKVENLQVAPTKEKRAYNKKSKDELIKKEKRPYNKKIKS